MCDSVCLLQTYAARQATGSMGAGTAPGARVGQVTLCCQLTSYCLASEVLVALQSQMLLHCTCVIADS